MARLETRATGQGGAALIKALGFFIILLSGYWLSMQFDLNSFLWVLFGAFLVFAEDIIRGIFNGKRQGH
jgi:hypothetical protein